MKNNIYVLKQRQDETFDAAGKAMRDVFSVLADKKAKIIWSVPKHCSKYLKLLDLPYLVLFLLFCVKKSDSVFYSIPENHLKIRLLKRLQLLKKYRIICFINDLNAFRYDGQNDGDPGPEVKLSAATKEEAIAKILEERVRELTWGLRWFDIRRLNYNETTLDDVNLKRIFYSHDGLIVNKESQPIEYRLELKDRRFAEPINSNEIYLSRGQIQQNTY